MLRRDRSIEARVRRAHRRLFFWRLVGDIIEIPLKLVSALSNAICAIFASLSKTVFYLELEAAREYMALTGADLAYALGETNRYGGLTPGRAQEAQQALFERLQMDDEE